MNPANIYIDEFGNTHLDLSKKGTFSHFVYASVIIDKSDTQKAEDLRKKLCRNFRLGPDLKSSNIKEAQFSKRLDILTELVAGLDFKIDILVINKAKLTGPGLKHKRVFYKYFQSLFVNKYNQKFESFSIFADKVGEDFKKELTTYVLRKGIQKDLFNQERSFALADDKNEKLIQLADFICGCAGKIFCTSHSHDRAKELFNLIHTRSSIEYFPFESSSILEVEPSTEIDTQIRKMNLAVIKKYYEKKQSTSREKSRLLEYLRFQAEINPERLVPTSELLYYMNNYYPKFSSEKVRTLIRDLRYDGLFIVSHSGKSGYKLANSYNDIYEHFKHFLKYVVPMLQKIKILNSTISDNSFNKINPIEKDPQLVQLSKLLSGIN